MTSKELRKLSRKELVELFLAHARGYEEEKGKLTHELEQTRTELSRELEVTRKELELAERTIRQLETEAKILRSGFRQAEARRSGAAETPQENPPGSGTEATAAGNAGDNAAETLREAAPAAERADGSDPEAAGSRAEPAADMADGSICEAAGSRAEPAADMADGHICEAAAGDEAALASDRATPANDGNEPTEGGAVPEKSRTGEGTEGITEETDAEKTQENGSKSWQENEKTLTTRTGVQITPL